MATIAQKIDFIRAHDMTVIPVNEIDNVYRVLNTYWQPESKTLFDSILTFGADNQISEKVVVSGTLEATTSYNYGSVRSFLNY